MTTVAQLSNQGLVPNDLMGQADERNIEVIHEIEPVSISDYVDDPTTKRQLFWLSSMSQMLGKCEAGLSMLDIGSNLQWLIGIAASRDLTMVDVRKHPLADVFPFKMVEANATDLPFEDNSFDLVTVPQVLHWVGSGIYGDPINLNADIEMLSEISRVLKPGGRIAFTTFLVPEKTIFKIAGRRLFYYDDLVDMLADYGFAVDDIGFFNAACEQIELADIQAPSGKILTPGNPDEDLSWAIGTAKLTC